MRRRLHQCEHGAVFIQVGLVIFVLMAFNVFVLDYGVFWIARGQAQNAADAGALAGAVARGFDDFSDPPSQSGIASRIARAVAQANDVWQEPGTAVVSYDCPPGVTGTCTRVDVHRNGQGNSNPLDTFFGPILGVSEQRVRATATAVTRYGNATTCLRPWAFADNWIENTGSPTEFNHYNASGVELPIGSRDEYTAPSTVIDGNTTIGDDFGYPLGWNAGQPLNPGEDITHELVVPVELPGGRTFEQNMTACVGEPIALNATLRVLPAVTPDMIRLSVDALFNQDPAADYDYPNSRIVNSCAPNCGSVTPRLMAIALYDPRRYQLGRSLTPPNWTDPRVGCPTNQPCIRISNIVGYFVHRITPVPPFGRHGHLMRYPGIVSSTPGVPTFSSNASWLVTTHLIR